MAPEAGHSDPGESQRPPTADLEAMMTPTRRDPAETTIDVVITGALVVLSAVFVVAVMTGPSLLAAALFVASTSGTLIVAGAVVARLRRDLPPSPNEAKRGR